MARILVIGGQPESLVNFRGPLLAALREDGHEVLACAGGPAPQVARRLAEMGVGYRSLALERAGMNPVCDLALFRQLIRLMRAQRPDAILAYTVKPVVWGALAARAAGVPRSYAIITGLGYAFLQGGSASRRLAGALVPRLYRMALAGCDRVFFQNPDDQDLFLARGLVPPERAVVVDGSGIDLERFPLAPLPPPPVSFLLIARLLRDKGVREYVEAARRVRACHPEVRCRLLGPFDPNPAAVRRAELDAWVREGVIDYAGETDDVRPALAAASVYVLPSYREGTPRTVLEAMATGRPVITTDAPGCRETVQPGRNGLLVPVRDAAALADAMRRFVQRPETIGPMGLESRRIAEARYDVRRVNRQLMREMALA